MLQVVSELSRVPFKNVGREEMNAGVVVNPLAAIKGKIAGVNIQKSRW